MTASCRSSIHRLRDVVVGARRRELEVVDVVESCLARIDGDAWGAVIDRRDDAVLSEARSLGRRIKRGESVGPLAGLCFTVKTRAALRTGVLPATAGSLLVDGRPGRPAGAVTRLRRADAMLVGVTNCAEFALAPDAANLRYGRTTNPVAPGRTPGGSSAGCAAAVAFRRCPLLVSPVTTCPVLPEGTDTPFSVLAPSRAGSLLGIAALAVPAGRTTEGIPVGVQLVGAVPELLSAAVELAKR